jgi:aconitate hydratase
MPELIGVKLTGKLSGWASPKDVILKLAGILTVKGGTNAIIEYFGEGTDSLSATGKATICNMGAEVGATTSIFPYDKKSSDYLKATGRADVAELADKITDYLQPDTETVNNPEDYFDRVIEIDLSALEPFINGPFTPDAAHPVSEFAKVVKEKGYPRQMEVGLIGSCTNSSYEDLSRAVSIVKDAKDKHIKVKAQFIINPGSEQVRSTAERDGILPVFEEVGATIMANACGPCIGQWKRDSDNPERPNSIVTSFNRNFAKRNDGNPNTHAFVTSPEMVAALSIAGDLCFNPMTDTLTNEQGEKVKLDEPRGYELPPRGYERKESGFTAPVADGSDIEIKIAPDSRRLQELKPFPTWDGKDITVQPLLIKVKGKCTTDHISIDRKSVV